MSNYNEFPPNSERARKSKEKEFIRELRKDVQHFRKKEVSNVLTDDEVDQFDRTIQKMSKLLKCADGSEGAIQSMSPEDILEGIRGPGMSGILEVAKEDGVISNISVESDMRVGGGAYSTILITVDVPAESTNSAYGGSI